MLPAIRIFFYISLYYKEITCFYLKIPLKTKVGTVYAI